MQNCNSKCNFSFRACCPPGSSNLPPWLTALVARRAVWRMYWLNYPSVFLFSRLFNHVVRFVLFFFRCDSSTLLLLITAAVLRSSDLTLIPDQAIHQIAWKQTYLSTYLLMYCIVMWLLSYGNYIKLRNLIQYVYLLQEKYFLR